VVEIYEYLYTMDQISGKLTDKPGATGLVTLTGQVTDALEATLYVRRGQAPTDKLYDCKAELYKLEESCTLARSGNGDLYFTLKAGRRGFPAMTYVWAFLNP